MQVRDLSIRNYRGIKDLNWSTAARFVCLIGIGDSSKTTVLRAIDLVLCPRWNPQISDGDFYQCDVSNPIEIVATVSGLPIDLQRLSHLGPWLRGVAADGTIHDEPEPGDERSLTIRFSVDATLEPKWSLVKSAMPEERSIGASDRAELGVFLVGEDPDSHLKWVRGSALLQVGVRADPSSVLIGARRAARQAVFDAPSAELDATAAQAAVLMMGIGGAAMSDPRAGLDPSQMRRGESLLLHDGAIPATQFGGGTQRLSGLAFQLAACSSQSIVLIDEIEHGLEPHRLLHVLRALQRRATEGNGQVILTTHSPLVVTALPATTLCIARSNGGTVTLSEVPQSLEGLENEPQSIVRTGPSAMLSRQILVCEGKTEVGLLTAVIEYWDLTATEPAALLGTALRHGEGCASPKKAQALAGLGYRTALVADDDLQGGDRIAFEADVVAAGTKGVTIVRWANGHSIESQLINDLPTQGINALLALAADVLGDEQTVRDQVSAHLHGATLSGLGVEQWVFDASVSESEMRAAIAKAASIGKVGGKKGWFKDQTRGESLGQVLVQHIDDFDLMSGTVATLAAVHEFIYGPTVPAGAQLEAAAGV